MIYCTHPDHMKPGKIPWVLGERCKEHSPKPRYKFVDGKWVQVN